MKLTNEDIVSVLKRIKKSNQYLLCVGAGDQLKEACLCFDSYGFTESISRIFDNNVSSFSYGERRFPVHKLNEISKYAKDSVIYICGNKRYVELYELLDKIPELQDIECYIHNYVRHIPVGKTEISSTVEEKIPHCIHYCWFGGKEIPDKNKMWMDSWKEYCPDYEIVRWDETNYDYRKNPFMKKAYELGKYAFVSDCARLEIIYENGGIYLDNDVELLQNLDPLTKNRAFCGTYYSVPAAAFGLGFGGEKNFPLFKEMFEMYNDAEYVGNRYEDTCLYFQTEVIKKYGFNPLLNTQQKIKDLTIYSTEVLSPMDLDGTLLALTRNSYAIHHFDASWYDEKDKNGFDDRRGKCAAFYNKHRDELGKFISPQI